MVLPELASVLQAASETSPAGALAEGDTAALLGLAVLQGLTEFLPVSSSGHLVLGRELFGLRSIDAVLVTVALHAGTLIAVLGVYGKDLLGVLREALARRPRELLLLFVGSLPAAAVGLGLGDLLEPLFESPDAAAAGLLATAAILLLGEGARRRRTAHEAGGGTGPAEQAPMRVSQALWIGAAQALAIAPGISRSGSTISAGLLCGLDAPRAARFSFLLSLPAVGGAALLEARELDGLPQGGLESLLLSLIVSAVVGLLALRLLLVALRRGSFPWFAGYCALAALTWFLFG